MENNSVTKNSFYNIIYMGMNVLFPLITSAYIARILLPDNIGRVSYAQNLASYFVTFASLGLPSYGLREISKAREDQNKLDKTFSELLTINIVSSLICTAAYFFIVIGIPSYRENFLLYAACGLPVLLNVINVDWFYQGLEEYRYITIRSIVIKAISVVAIFLFIHQKSDYILYALIVSLATVGNYIFNIFHARKIVKFSIKGCEYRKHFKPLLIFALILLLSSIYSKIDILMLGGLSTHKAVGYYSYAQKIISIVLSICSAATSVLMPRLSLYYQDNREQFSLLLQKGVKIITFVAFPIAVGLFILGENVIVFLYGEAFRPATTTVRIFVPLILIKTYGDLLCYQVIIATNNEIQSIKASAIGSGVNIILNSLLIPSLMEKGAAIASVLAELALNLYEFVFTKKHVGYKIPYKNIIQAIISSTVMGFAVYGVTKFALNQFLTIILGVFIGMLVYGLINLLFKNDVLFGFLRRVELKN